MSKELVISANRHETRVALIEDDQLVEVYFQRANEYSLAGSIHKGRVTRVLPGMQSAFRLIFGLERDTFLPQYVSDFLEEGEDIDRVTGDEAPAPRERDRDRDRDRGREHRPQPPRAEVEPAAPSPVAAEAPAAAAGPAMEAPAPSGDRPPHSDDRGRPDDRGDGRGRRSRRRRNRGRGFPDSKYSSENAGPRGASPVESEPEIAAAEEEETPAGSEPPIILPGESLAKYRGAGSSAETPAAHEPRDDAREAAPAPEVMIDEVENEYDEVIHYPPENALPDAPTHEPAQAAAATHAVPPPLPPPLPPMLPEEPAIAEELIEVDEVEEEQHAEAEDSAEPVVAPMLDEEEDRDIQEMILSRVEIEEGAEESGEDSTEDAVDGAEEESGEPGAEGEARPAGEPDSGTAAVRERGGRYPHRVSRRMRRGRGRGPGQGPAPFGPPPAQGEHARGGEPRGGQREERSVARPVPGGGMPSISDLLKEGQEIIVQIAKEPLGQKGARITSHVALPGRYVVYMPTLEHMGVSRKIGSDEERLRLKRILQGRRPGPMGGFITRTAAEGRTEEEIAVDMAFLYNLWQDIRRQSRTPPRAHAALHHDLDIVRRILRDQLGDSFKAIWIDSEETYESVLRFVERFQPALVGKVKLLHARGADLRRVQRDGRA